MSPYTDEAYDQAIAVVGMAGLYSQAPTVNNLWENLLNGYEAVRFLDEHALMNNGCPPSAQSDPFFVPASAMLGDEIFQFDSEFFNFTPAEAEMMDPQLRQMLQVSWHCFENAGITPGKQGGLTGVFAGAHKSDYLLCNMGPDYNIQMGMKAVSSSILNGLDFLSTWISYKFGLEGPSINVQTACSTGLLTVATACQNLLDYSCDTALAVNGAIFFPRDWGYFAEPGSIVSKDGHCRPFDAQAQGTVTGEGVGAVLLRRLSDALKDNDTILGVIRGFAVNNDGSRRAGFTAPGVAGQKKLLSQALVFSGLKPSDVGYIEAHGTGTNIGDPIEFQALKSTYGISNSGSRHLLGSIKANLGHLGACAGMVGLHKLLLMLTHEKIPPQINFSTPHPETNFDKHGFSVATETTPWPDDLPKRAAVSSFGLGGTNCHLILEAFAETQQRAATTGNPLHTFDTTIHKLTPEPNLCDIMRGSYQAVGLHTSPQEKADPPQQIENTPDGDQNEVIGLLCSIWNTALGVNDIAPDDDFFMRGGTSLSAINILAEIEKQTGLGMQMQDILHLKTINNIADRLAQIAQDTP